MKDDQLKIQPRKNKNYPNCQSEWCVGGGKFVKTKGENQKYCIPCLNYYKYEI